MTIIKDPPYEKHYVILCALYVRRLALKLLIVFFFNFSAVFVEMPPKQLELPLLIKAIHVRGVIC